MYDSDELFYSNLCALKDGHHKSFFISRLRHLVTAVVSQPAFSHKWNLRAQLLWTANLFSICSENYVKDERSKLNVMGDLITNECKNGTSSRQLTS